MEEDQLGVKQTAWHTLKDREDKYDWNSVRGWEWYAVTLERKEGTRSYKDFWLCNLDFPS